MMVSKSTIIAQLQQEILSLGGIKPPVHDTSSSGGLSFMNDHFPQQSFPLAAIHEFLSNSKEDTAATAGFIAAVISSCFEMQGVVVWISRYLSVFPPALSAFNIDPSKVVFIQPSNEKESLWVMEESLKCNGVRAVVSELEGVSFTNSRRFQLAVEKSRVTGFIINSKPGKPVNNACLSRWKIQSVSSELPDNIPGVGHPRWLVELQKIRNGVTGRWTVEWASGKFSEVFAPAFTIEVETLQKRTG